MRENNVVIFDGVCNLCNWSVQFIIKHDPKAIFKFTSLQSELAQLSAKDISSLPKTQKVFCYSKTEKCLAKVQQHSQLPLNLMAPGKPLLFFASFPKTYATAFMTGLPTIAIAGSEKEMIVCCQQRKLKNALYSVVQRSIFF